MSDDYIHNLIDASYGDSEATAEKKGFTQSSVFFDRYLTANIKCKLDDEIKI